VDPHPAMIAPFALLLACIALMPFMAKHWWEHHYSKVAIGLGLVTTAYYFFGLHAGERIGHSMIEYISFIALIGSLFVVCGGIHITVAGEAKPWVNALFLSVGSVLANIVGTTGASMLMIRPWIRMNKFRFSSMHTVFFIFIVSNTAGCLTPIGDPPLFLGYLKGVPFQWTLIHLFWPWVLITSLLVGVFFVFDTLNFNKVPANVRKKQTEHETWKFLGMHNAIFLGLILIAVFLPSPTREILMAVSAVASYFTTPNRIHNSNDFTFAPIKEVAFLFLGIFATMVPALDYLAIHSQEIGITSADALFYGTGALSATLDNAPTYLTFLATSVGGLTGAGGVPLDMNSPRDILEYIHLRRIELIAISLGAVWFGAMTYIGNGPNFMVKSIVEHGKCHAPHFLEYIYKWSLPILLPLLAFSGWVTLHLLK
jgi:Na+/H+ antiporter NhaD/arsenite permease-like protein